MTSTTRSSSASQLLSSDLSDDVLGEQILTFLDRKSVVQLLSVTPVREHFHLRRYYCSDHGTKLERYLECDHSSNKDEQQKQKQDDEEEEERHDDTPDDEQPKFADDKDDQSKEVHLRCEDCVQAEFGRVRCTQCDGFDLQDEMSDCMKCSRELCQNCDFDQFSGHCDDCHNHYCGQGNCPPVFYCERCGGSKCAECEPYAFCDECGEDLGCFECSLEVSFRCDACFGSYCHDCKPFYSCDDCDDCFCRTCKDSFFCTQSEERYCKTCKEFADCEDCGARLCQSYTFQCSECETITCPACTKAYACPDCGKEVCDVCQDVFRKCCCEKKGKFTLIPSTK